MVKFDRQGLLPTVIVDDATGDVLMVAFMNEEALTLTQETGFTHFFSRSRNAIWRKGEQSGHRQEVRGIFINCEENSLLIRVVQHGEAACHDGYRSCYYRRLLPDDSYEMIAQRLFDPTEVYGQKQKASQTVNAETQQKLDVMLRQLYGVYIYLRDHDLSEESNTSRLLHERSHTYLVSRLADELEELASVLSGEHIHTGKQADTVLEGSQVGYWLFLIAAGSNIPYGDFQPGEAMLEGYSSQYSEAKIIEIRQECLNLLSQSTNVARGLQLGFVLIGHACAEAGVEPLEPAEYDLNQMRRKGLV